MRIATVLTVMACGVVLPACHHAPPPPAQPAPRGPDLAMKARQDSIDAANRARADSLARARAKEAEAERLAGEAATLRDRLLAMIHFDFDRSDLLPPDVETLSGKTTILRAHEPVRIRIEGHCDERGSDEYNLALGMRRAMAAKRYLAEHGVAADRLETVSYGKERPLDPGHDETAWAKNRRDQFVIVAGAESLTPRIAMQ